MGTVRGGTYREEGHTERRDIQRGGTYREVGHTQRGGTYRENMDRLPTLERFLCCCDLKTGTLIIGVFNLICAVLLGILSLFGLATMIFATVVVNTTDQQKMNEALSNFNNNFNTEGDLGQGLDTATSEEAKTAANVALIFSIVMMAILCIICVGYVIVASMLIHGARTSKPGLLMPWIILTIVSLIYDLIRIVGYLIALDFTHLGSSIVGMVIGIYLFICVCSFRKQLLEEQAPRPIPLQKA